MKKTMSKLGSHRKSFTLDVDINFYVLLRAHEMCIDVLLDLMEPSIVFRLIFGHEIIRNVMLLISISMLSRHTIPTIVSNVSLIEIAFPSQPLYAKLITFFTLSLTTKAKTALLNFIGSN